MALFGEQRSATELLLPLLKGVGGPTRMPLLPLPKEGTPPVSSLRFPYCRPYPRTSSLLPH